jgi:hypothetical protein
MSLKLNGLSPDQTAVAIDILLNLRRIPVGEHYFVVPFSRDRQTSLLAEDARIRREAKRRGISVEVHWIAPHTVNKRSHPRVNFTTRGRLNLPLTAVFVFPTWRDQLFFKMWFG